MMLYEMMDVSSALCSHHFTIQAYINSLCCTTKTNILLYVNYISVKKKRWTEVAWGENLTCFES